MIETLQGVEAGRKCFRMVGGVLVERTVGDVLPELETNRERLPKALEVTHVNSKYGSTVLAYLW